MTTPQRIELEHVLHNGVQSGSGCSYALEGPVVEVAGGPEPPRQDDQVRPVDHITVRGFGRIDIPTAERVSAVIRWHDRPDCSHLVSRVRATSSASGEVGWVSVRGVRNRPAARSWLARTLDLPPREALNKARIIAKVLRMQQTSTA